MALESQPLSIANVIDGKNGTNGKDGVDGTNGKDGVSVVGVEIGYAQSTSGNVTPTSGWQDTIPTPVPGEYLWTRSRNVFSNGTYGAYAYTISLIGRDAIIVSDTAPSNPVVGTLWQKPTDPTVLKWNGTSWVDWGISAENIVADNLTVSDGKFSKLVGTEIESGKFVNPYTVTYTDKSKGTGTITMEKSGVSNTMIQRTSSDAFLGNYFSYLRANYILMGSANESGNANYDQLFLNPDGLSMQSFADKPGSGGVGYGAEYMATGIRMTDSRSSVGTGELNYSDLINVSATPISAASGWSQYATSGSNLPTATRNGRIVSLSGAFKNNSPLNSANTVYTIGTLPLQFRPLTEQRILTKGAGTSIQMMIITTSGDIQIQYRLGWTGSTYGYISNNAGDIFNIHCNYPGANIV